MSINCKYGYSSNCYASWLGSHRAFNTHQRRGGNSALQTLDLLPQREWLVYHQNLIPGLFLLTHTPLLETGTSQSFSADGEEQASGLGTHPPHQALETRPRAQNRAPGTGGGTAGPPAGWAGGGGAEWPGTCSPFPPHLWSFPYLILRLQPSRLPGTVWVLLPP